MTDICFNEERKPQTGNIAWPTFCRNKKKIGKRKERTGKMLKAKEGYKEKPLTENLHFLLNTVKHDREKEEGRDAYMEIVTERGKGRKLRCVKYIT